MLRLELYLKLVAIMRKDTAENIIKIVNCLKNAEGGWLWVREIARRCNLHHKTVSRLVSKHLSIFVDAQEFEPFNVHMIRLKPGTDQNKIFHFLSIKERIDNNKKE